MPLHNDEELAAAVAKVSELLQDIQAYAKRDCAISAKVRFPRGYIPSAAEVRTKLRFLNNSHLKSNIVCTMLLSDVQHWLLVRTDLAGTVRDMVIKLQLFLLGNIVASATKAFLQGQLIGNFSKRTAYLESSGIISAHLRAELDWLWARRNEVHLFQIENVEWVSTEYTAANHHRATNAFKALLAALNNVFPQEISLTNRGEKTPPGSRESLPVTAFCA